jgi:hypothetical protein
MITENVKIKLSEKDTSFAARERKINTEVQKQIDLYNSQGFNVVETTTVNKTGSHAVVKFSLIKMFGRK